MAGDTQTRKKDKPSIKYRYNPHGGSFFDLVDVIPENYAPSSHDNIKQPNKQSEATSCMISTADLISGIGKLWDFTNTSLPVLHHKTTLKQNNENLQKENTFYYPGDKGKIIASTSSKGKNASIDSKTDTRVSTSVKMQPNLLSLHIAKKMSSFGSCSEIYMYYHRWRCLNNGLSSVTISYGLQNIYGWMSNKRNKYHCSAKDTTCVERSDNNMIRSTDDSHTEQNETLESSSRENANDMIPTSAVEDVEAAENHSIVPTCSLQAESDISYLNPASSSNTECLTRKENYQQRQFVIEEKSDMEISSSTLSKIQYSNGKQEHAFAGAFAGVFVSLCLHPVDTVKTVIQSCRADQRSIPYISKSIISERGLSGLYRGIASNVASSAPISAVYTFTYESVKGALLPLIAKEYHSLVHCVAGGSASVATSFIFTPSERIKQQLQVGSHYHNCWNAIFDIVGKGGFSSLYTGWVAVLCRNVPHSIIKFYTYETLKHEMFSSLPSNAQSTATLTLVCGGIAGSTAALFTTPFDVVKTRLQTQIPGSVNRYHGVFNTLKQIAVQEGLKGLYRGLTPRLAMYMTQGALFFASYESFQRLFSSKSPKLKATMEDDASAKDS